jgi:hypothetical protein
MLSSQSKNVVPKITKIIFITKAKGQFLPT